MEPLWPGRPLDAGHTFCRVELSHCAASGGSASDGEGLVQANGGDVVALRNMANELSVWFLKHAQTMDAALALHLRRVGHDPLTGKVQHPGALPANLIQGCSAGECIGAATV